MDYLISQNYPNPFNPTATISVALPERGWMRLSVFNQLGQEVAVLADQEMSAGHHDFRFDGWGLASGVYFYRLHAGEVILTKKMLMPK